MSGASDYSEPFKVTCPRCDCRFSPAVRDASYFAKCPDCSEPVRVPAAAEVEVELERARESQGYGDTYRLALPPGFEKSTDGVNYSPYQSEPQTPPKVREEKPHPRWEPESSPRVDADKPTRNDLTSEPPAPVISQASCPACGAKFDMLPSERPQVVLCPECLEDVHLPGSGNVPQQNYAESPPVDNAKVKGTPKPSDSDRESFETDDIHFDAYPEDSPEPSRTVDKPKKKRRKHREDEPSAIPAENPTRKEKSSKNVFDVMAEVRQVGEDPPPEWTFFSGVTDFLIRPEVALRWVYTSLGVCVMGWMMALCLHFYETFPIALPFFVLPLIWIAIMALSYLSANSMAILIDTAGGNDKVDAWPEPIIKEQAVDLVYLSFVMIVAQVCSFFLGGFLGMLIGGGLTLSVTILFLLYPIILLSTLEANSPFVPLSLPILRSLKTVHWAWGVFYALSGGLLLVWLWPVLWLLDQSGWTQFIGMIFLSPLIAGWCLLYGRLLGRLAWRASLEFPEEEEPDEEDAQENPKPKKRKKKSRPAESSGELQTTR